MTYPYAERAREIVHRVFPSNTPGYMINSEQYEQLLAEFATALAEAVAANIRAFAKAIQHGDDAHEAWLFESAEKFIRGEPVTTVRGKASAEALAEAVAAETERCAKVAEGGLALLTRTRNVSTEYGQWVSSRTSSLIATAIRESKP